MRLAMRCDTIHCMILLYIHDTSVLMLWFKIRLASLHRLARVRILGGGFGCSDHVEFENSIGILILSLVFEKIIINNNVEST